MEVKLKLKVKDIEIELSVDEAKKLRDTLEWLVGAAVLKEPEYIPYPVEPYRPWWYRWPWWCDATNTRTTKWEELSNDVSYQVSYSA
jgi:hypothetical protein